MSVQADTDPLFSNGGNGKKDLENDGFIQPDIEDPGTSGSGSGSANNMNSSSVHGQIDQPPSYNQDQQNQKKGGLLSFSYYSRFFDVDTRDVMDRSLLALNPVGKTPFIIDDDLESGENDANNRVLGRVAGGSSGRPDLWGPFWICTTVVLVLFFSSTLVGILFSSWQGVKYEYKFDLLTGAAGLMYGYTFIFPFILWIALRYLNISPATTLLQLISLYGYSNVTWIPVAILSVSPLLGIPKVSNIIRWVFIGLGYAFSGSFIGKNIYRKLLPEHNSSATGRQPATIILALCIIAHTALAFAVKMLFFGGVEVKDKD